MRNWNASGLNPVNVALVTSNPLWMADPTWSAPDVSGSLLPVSDRDVRKRRLVP